MKLKKKKIVQPEKVKQQVFQKPTITEPQPFDLLTEQRGAYYKSYQEIKQKEEEQNKRYNEPILPCY